MDELAARAERHAALSDRTRLRVVDLLAVGDRTPRDLQAELGISSNLVAHHLGVLERVRIVQRRRSDADRRRTYVQLVPERLPVVAGPVPDWEGSDGVVFVCTANSARSQLAAALWNDHVADDPGTPGATSAGTHPGDRVDPGAVQAARRRGLRLADRPVGLDELGLVSPSRLVVTVCDSAHEELARTGALADVRELHWSVPDPVPLGTAAAFDDAASELLRRIRSLTPPRPHVVPDLSAQSHAGDPT
ncbi:MAG: ArsR family transcriptional regulator [Nocardioides sp.]|nr:ArsR family transcriptional regulator [Nocardioides sp.]